MMEARAGEAVRTGGVPNRGGEVPRELDKAAARAETPGPATCEPGPGSGVKWPEAASSPAGGCRLFAGDEPSATGEASRAVDSARPKDRPRNEPGDDANCCIGGGEFLNEFDMVAVVV